MIYAHYFWRLLKHKWFVFQAGRGTVSFWQLLIHDLSKFGKTEFGPYARRYVSGRGGSLDHSKDPDEWHRAWLHHWHSNPHHWEYWLKIQDGQLVPHEIPQKYLLEMIADWKGAARAYTGARDVAPWYLTNHNRIILHPKSRRLVEEQLFDSVDLANAA